MELESHLKGEDLLVELQLMELGNVAFTFGVAQIMTPDSHIFDSFVLRFKFSKIKN